MLSYPSIESRLTAFCVLESDFLEVLVLDAARFTLLAALGVDEAVGTPLGFRPAVSVAL
jgi:hypothetical protein